METVAEGKRLAVQGLLLTNVRRRFPLCFASLGDPLSPYVFSTEAFCPRLLEVHNSVERNVIRRITCVDTHQICSNLRNLAGDRLVINERKKDVLPLECIQHGLKVLHGGDSTSKVHHSKQQSPEITVLGATLQGRLLREARVFYSVQVRLTIR